MSEQEIRIISVQQMRDSDSYTIAHYISGRELMLRAAQGVYDSFDWQGRKTAVLCGGGNNGGDGYALAMLLGKSGRIPTVFQVSDSLSEDGRYYHGKAAALGIPIQKFTPETDLSVFDVIVDCILGTGFRGQVRGLAEKAIEAVNRSSAFVISVDINSGMNGDTGEGSLIIRSDLTVSIGYFKKGLFLGQSAEKVGSLKNVDIGIRLVSEKKPVDFSLLCAQLEEFIQTEPFYLPVLCNASALLMDSMSGLNWAGFYLVRENELVVGPFQGKPACIRIRSGKGVCGNAWAQDKTLVVGNVHEFPGHIACDSASESEIVIPVHKNGKVIGVLDIDSPQLERFAPEDAAGLESFVRVLENGILFDREL